MCLAGLLHLHCFSRVHLCPSFTGHVIVPLHYVTSPHSFASSSVFCFVAVYCFFIFVPVVLHLLLYLVPSSSLASLFSSFFIFVSSVLHFLFTSFLNSRCDYVVVHFGGEAAFMFCASFLYILFFSTVWCLITWFFALGWLCYFFFRLFSFVFQFLLPHACIHVLWFLPISFYFICLVFYYVFFWVFSDFPILFEVVSVYFVVCFATVFPLVARSQGNIFLHRHQLWFGLPFGCKFLEKKILCFLSNFWSTWRLVEFL